MVEIVGITNELSLADFLLCFIFLLVWIIKIVLFTIGCLGDGSEDDKDDSDERTEAAPGTSRVGSEPGDLLDSARKEDSDEGKEK